MPITPLVVDSVEALAARPGRTIVFKDSGTCELSQWAAHQLAKLVNVEEVMIHRVDVHSQRALSQAIEAYFGVRHESPQLLFIDDGKVTWHSSHRALRTERVSAAIAAIDGETPESGARS